MNNLYKKYAKWLAVLLLVATLAVNYIVSAFKINGTTTGEVSDFYPNLFAPISLTFAIWGLIYLFLCLYIIRQFGVWGDKSDGSRAAIDKITKPFILSSIINIAWIFAWQYRIIWLSLLLIVALLVVLIRINLSLKSIKLTSRDNWLIKFPFVIYFGWLTVATIANATTWLVSVGWDRFGLSEQFWTVAVMLIGALIGVVTALRFASAAYILVFAWAYLGIFLKHISADYFSGNYPLIIWLAGFLIGIYLLVAGWIISRQRK